MSFSVSPVLIFLVCVFLYFGFWSVLLPVAAIAAAHELGHLLALRLCGVRLRALRLGAFGAVLEHAPTSCGKELLCAAAGPCVNLLLWLLLPAGSPAAAISLGMLLYNLLPIYPLDGGRILRCLLLSRLCLARTELWMARIAQGTVAVLLCASFYLTIALKLNGFLLISAGFLVIKCIFLAKDSRS